MDDVTALREQLAHPWAREEIDLEALERVLKDAERYRWLRAQHWSTSPYCVVANPKEAVKLAHTCPPGEYLDMAVDDEMAAAPAVDRAA